MLNRRSFGLMIGASLLCPGMAPGISRADDIRQKFIDLPKAVWVFRQSLDDTSLKTLKNNCQNWGISTVWLGLNSSFRAILANPTAAAFKNLSLMRERSIKTQALLGDANWCRTPYKFPNAVRDLLKLNNFSDFFQGVHLDIEPHTLPEWKDGSGVNELMNGYLTLLKTIRAALPKDFPMAVDIPHTYTKRTLNNGQNFTDSIIPLVDDIGLMTYRTPAQEAVRLAATTTNKFEKLQTSWWMGVHCQSTPEQRVSHFQTTKENFWAEMIDFDYRIRQPGTFCHGLAFYELNGLNNILS